LDPGLTATQSSKVNLDSLQRGFVEDASGTSFAVIGCVHQRRFRHGKRLNSRLRGVYKWWDLRVDVAQ
jgi:hypothetical protein